MEEKKINKKIIMSLIWTAVVIFLTIADQVTKYLITSNFEYAEKKEVIPGFFYLHYVRNTGSAFSFLADQSWGIYFLSGFSIIVGLAIFVFMIYTSDHGFKFMSFALSLLTAGAIGNVIDRIRLSYVVDFLRFDFGSWTFPIFNFADICAVCGTIIIICIAIFANKYFDGFLASVKKGKK